MPGYVDDYLNGKIQLDGMVTHTMPLEDINKAKLKNSGAMQQELEKKIGEPGAESGQ